MKWFVLLLLLLPAVDALQLIPSRDVNNSARPFVVFQGGTHATIANFSIDNNGSSSKKATIFAYSSDTNIVTIGKAAEVQWHVTIPNETVDYSIGLYGVNLGKAKVTYGYLIDVSPPFVYGGEPYGRLDLGTRVVNLTVTTNEADAVCRYSSSKFTSYRNMKESMDRRVRNSHTEHVAVISGLQNNKTYEYFVRCWRPINWSSQGNYSSFDVNVTCIRDGWCSPGRAAKDTDIAYNYSNMNDEDYKISFSVGNYYPAPKVEPVVERPSGPINITLIVPDPIVPMVEDVPKVQLANTSNRSNAVINTIQYVENASVHAFTNVTPNRINVTQLPMNITKSPMDDPFLNDLNRTAWKGFWWFSGFFLTVLVGLLVLTKGRGLW